MTAKILIADGSARDANKIRGVVEEAGLSAKICGSGAEVAACLDAPEGDWGALLILWEIPGPPFGFELLVRSRRKFPKMPVIVLSGALDANLAARAANLGAQDFLEKPLDMQRVKACVSSVLKSSDPLSPLVAQLNQRIFGDSPALRSTLNQLASAIQDDAERLLLIGESGTGKELLARAFHELSLRSEGPFVAVNAAAIPKELIESLLFGHERGAFTGADQSHRGYLEEAEEGTLFLDEIGELNPDSQAKLLRAIQERKFRRVKGSQDVDFKARLVCATNVDLVLAVKRGDFRKDLFHRIAEMTIQIPPLRERGRDIDSLLAHFLSLYAGGRQVQFARETLTILRSYPFDGNVRELENFVKGALRACKSELILPKHLPLPTMGAFLDPEGAGLVASKESRPVQDGTDKTNKVHDELFQELLCSLPLSWRELPYKEMFGQYERSFDRIYLPRILERYHHNVTRAAKAAGVDKKTFAQHWKNAGLPPLRAVEGESND